MGIFTDLFRQSDKSTKEDHFSRGPQLDFGTDDKPNNFVTSNAVVHPTSKTRLVPQALIRALNNYVREEVAYFVECAPTMRFQLNEIQTLLTSDNLHLLQSMLNFPEQPRNMVVENCIRQCAGNAMFDLKKFYGWRFIQENEGPNSKIYTELAGTGRDNVEIPFFFVGEWVDVGKPIDMENETNSFMTPSVCSEKKSFRQEESCKSKTPLARFTVGSEKKTPLHELSVYKRKDFPILIGRDSLCDLRLDRNNRYISRKHLMIIVNRAGKLFVKSITDKGLEIHPASGEVVRMAEGEKHPIHAGDKLLLSPAAGKNAISIRCEIFTSTEDNMETLQPRSETVVDSPEKEARKTGETFVRQTSVQNTPKENNETVVSFGSSLRPAHGYIEVRYENGQEERVAIQDFPFEIGREPASDHHLVIADPNCHVSRRHLVVERRQNGCFYVENLAHDRSGTFMESGHPCGNRFSLALENNHSSNWIFLAGRKGDASVQLRILA